MSGHRCVPSRVAAQATTPPCHRSTVVRHTVPLTLALPSGELSDGLAVAAVVPLADRRAAGERHGPAAARPVRLRTAGERATAPPLRCLLSGHHVDNARVQPLRWLCAGRHPECPLIHPPFVVRRRGLGLQVALLPQKGLPQHALQHLQHSFPFRQN